MPSEVNRPDKMKGSYVETGVLRHTCHLQPALAEPSRRGEVQLCGGRDCAAHSRRLRAQVEQHMVEGELKQLLVHRKGSTRAFPPHHPLIPVDYQLTGQPVLIGGTMGARPRRTARSSPNSLPIGINKVVVW